MHFNVIGTVSRSSVSMSTLPLYLGSKRSQMEGVKQILAKRDPKLARNKPIFPTASYTKNCTFEPVLDGEQGREVTRAFNAVLNG